MAKLQNSCRQFSLASIEVIGQCVATPPFRNSHGKVKVQRWRSKVEWQQFLSLVAFLVRPDQGNFLFLIPARIDFCWPQEIKTQYKTHRIGFLERSLAKTQAWGPQIMSRLAWTTKITALCEVSSCVNSSVFVFLAPSRIIFSIFWDEKQEISLVWPKLTDGLLSALYLWCTLFERNCRCSCLFCRRC